MKKIREVIGYFLGGLLFVGLMPMVMWLASGMPALYAITLNRAVFADVLIFVGLALSVWTIIYMKRKGKGNPMDAFGHDVAPRTIHLMTGGPYRFNRNPMLTGTLVYLAGVAVWLWHWQAWAVLIVFFAIMLFQVFSEERRLRRDFGAEYEAYCRRTRRF
ncbi:MAG: isoprenylcysteine carboxylmethyltransferase family protein [Prevotella sp.]|nr:isoprenylcysteine carboxylmethyltransferase family protein [Prevotella sp.]